MGLSAVGPEVQIESGSRGTLDWRQGAWVLDLPLLKTHHLTLGKWSPLLYSVSSFVKLVQFSFFLILKASFQI